MERNFTISLVLHIRFKIVILISMFSLDSTKESVDIHNLLPFTLYEFVVQMSDASNTVGPFSHKVESRTLPGRKLLLAYCNYYHFKGNGK